MRADALGLFWQEMPKIKEAKVEEKYLPPFPIWDHTEHLPFYQEAMLYNWPIMTDQEVMEAARLKQPLIFDVECYINYFLCAFKNYVTGRVIWFEMSHDTPWSDNPAKLQWMLENCLIVGFNSNGYDIPILGVALAGYGTQALKAATQMIIGENMKGWMVLRQFKVKKQPLYNHIDIMEVAPLNGSLKVYAGRAGAPKMQDLPYRHDATLTDKQKVVVRFYCLNDLDNTGILFGRLQTELELRVGMSQEYGVDLRSKSDAQIAEAVIGHELHKLSGQKPVMPSIPPGTAYAYKVPAYMRFQTPVLRELLDMVKSARFVVGADGSVNLPPVLENLKVAIGGSIYKLGIGGLHSTEKKQCVFSSPEYELADIDVESYYPRIILNLGLFPQHLGRAFLKVLNTIVVRRLDAKHKKIKKIANSLKIVINGTFGKLGSKWSMFYAPDLLIQTTLTGQLSLLMLIEMMELAGLSVVSANTDGIVVYGRKDAHALREEIVAEWERITNFKMETTNYKALCSKDVNNYIAVKRPEDLEEGDDATKRKGLYAKPGLSKNPTAVIATEAVCAYLAHGTPIEQTIRECKDIQQFVSVRKVTGGAVSVAYRDPGEHVAAEVMQAHLRDTGWRPAGSGWLHVSDPANATPQGMLTAYATARWQPVSAEYLGGTIRWYYAEQPEGQVQRIIYAGAANKVPKSDGARPIMVMDGTIPADLDHGWYIQEANKILSTLGYGV